MNIELHGNGVQVQLLQITPTLYRHLKSTLNLSGLFEEIYTHMLRVTNTCAYKETEHSL